MKEKWNMLENIKAVIFDLDGTLVDSMNLWGEIDVDFLADRHIDMPEGLQQELEGLSMTETAVYFQQTFGLTDTVEELMTIWNNMARDAYLHHIPMKPGAIEFLTYLKEHEIPMGIATSNSRELVEATYQAHQLGNYITCCVTANEVEHGKPAPDVFLEAARRLEIDPKQCLVFEDIIAGIQAGHNANMKVCGIYDEYTKDISDEKKALADYYIEDYYEILGSCDYNHHIRNEDKYGNRFLTN